MPNNIEDKDKLLKIIRDKHSQITSYLQAVEPRGSRLMNRNIVFGGVASLLTAAQLAFGQDPVEFLKPISPAAGLSVWQLLAVAATICSAVATIAGAIYKQQEIASRLAKAQACGVKLEGLQTSLDLEFIDPKEANARYGQYISEVPFVGIGTRARGKYSVDAVKGEITSPVEFQSVPRAFRSAGSASDVGSDVHLWLAVEVNGLIWPKEGQILPDESGAWTATVFEDGVTDAFRLSLFAADRRAHKTIQAWLNSGRKSGTYSQITSLAGARRVAGVDGLRLTK